MSTISSELKFPYVCSHCHTEIPSLLITREITWHVGIQKKSGNGSWVRQRMAKTVIVLQLFRFLNFINSDFWKMNDLSRFSCICVFLHILIHRRSWHGPPHFFSNFLFTNLLKIRKLETRGWSVPRAPVYLFTYVEYFFVKLFFFFFLQFYEFFLCFILK